MHIAYARASSESVPTEIRLKPKAAEGAIKMADDPIIDIDPSAFADEEKKETSQSFLNLNGKHRGVHRFTRLF